MSIGLLMCLYSLQVVAGQPLHDVYSTEVSLYIFNINIHYIIVYEYAGSRTFGGGYLLYLMLPCILL